MERLFEIPRQGEVFLLLLGSGVLLGALWQGLGFLRRRLPRCGAVWDVLFALSLGGMLLLALLRWREQRLRLYALLGVCLGAAMYLAGPGAAVDALCWYVRKKAPRRQENPPSGANLPPHRSRTSDGDASLHP